MTPDQVKEEMLRNRLPEIIKQTDATLLKQGYVCDLFPALLIQEIEAHYKEQGWRVTCSGNDWGGTILLRIEAPKPN